MSTPQPPLKFLGAKVIALPVLDVARAARFYGEMLGLPPAYEGKEQLGYLLGETIVILKAEWYAKPTAEPNPRVTVATENAREIERGLRSRGVVIADPVQAYGAHDIGSFLDSEGNKIWFCSPS